MDLATLLLQSQTSILEDAHAALDRSHVHHYEAAGQEFTRQRLEDLFTLVVSAIRDRDLAQVSVFSRRIAEERFNQGFDIGEVQAAFNALEQSMWHQVVTSTAPEGLAEATGLLSTVLGFGKDVLARTYVELATKRHVRSLDLTAMFAGTQPRDVDPTHALP